MEYWKYNKTYGSAIFFQLFIGQKSYLLSAASWNLCWLNLQSAITPPLPLSPFQLISEDGEIVLLARLNQKEGVSGLLYTDNIVRL
jgi:hypothetical protein